MEVKKSPKADLEGKKTQWLLIGYVVVLAFIFVAFEWTERDIKIDTSQAVAQIEFEEEMIPITQQEEKPAPPPVEVPKQAEILKIVDDEADVQETAIASTEDTGQKVEVKYVPVEVKEEEPSEQEIFEVVENAPEFPGGMPACLQFLYKNIKYPPIAQENGTQGQVVLQFVVERDGSIGDIKVVKSVDPYLDKEALRVVKTMPKWKPGMQRGKPVRCRFTLPVRFRLQSSLYSIRREAAVQAASFHSISLFIIYLLCIQHFSFSIRSILTFQISGLHVLRQVCMTLLNMFFPWEGNVFGRFLC